MLLVVFLGLCTIFASVVTTAEAWQDHARAQWPEVMARIDRCSLDQSSTGRRQRYRIRCRLSYAVDTERNVANIYSRYVPSPEVWQYPPNQIGPLETWVDEHPQGTPILVHYDPANHNKAVLVTTDMPLAGPTTPNNRKLLKVVAGTFLGLLVLALLTRPRSDRQTEYSSTPLNR
jgi:hypothetical protein